ncbi:MAG: MotA/TolQ/ExbB proton channel family protein [bacterium JZ-2024 1]
MTLLEFLTKGGWTMVPLAALSVWSVALILERAFYFLWLGKPGGNPLIQEAREVVRGTRLTQDSPAFQRDTPASRVARMALEQPFDEVWEDRVRAVIRIERARLNRNIVWLGVIGALAPLLGLYGTILGLIRVFMVVEATSGRTTAQLLAAGIWEAMITTAAGLTIAFPAVFFYHIYRTIAERHLQSLIRVADEIRILRKEARVNGPRT